MAKRPETLRASRVVAYPRGKPYINWIMLSGDRQMPNWMPFTAQLKLTPARPEKRFERVRELQHLAHLIYESLQTQPSLNLALPGGGQAENYGRWSDLVYGTAVKPQFGETPAQATVTGFWDHIPVPIPSPVPLAASLAPQPQQQLIHAGAWVTGPYNQTPFKNNPSPIIQNQVKTLVVLLETAANAGLPQNVAPVTVFRLEFANIVWGDRGHTFPR